MKCPICGHRLARLADPCLHCASVLTGGGGASAAAAPVSIAPTSLTLPAELRVPEPPATATPPRAVPAGAADPQAISPAAIETLSAADSAPAASAHRGAAVTRPATAVPEGSTVPATPKPGRRAATRTWVLAGVALLVLSIGLGVQRHRDAAPNVPAVGASDEGRMVPIDADGADIPLAPARAVAPAPRTTADARASDAATSRVKTRAQTAKATEAAPSAPLPPVAATAVPSSPRPVAEPLLQAAPEPSVIDLREACSKRGFIASALCINERCAQPAYAGHAECIKLRRAAEDAELALQRGG